MMQGVVNRRCEATLPLVVGNENGQRQVIDAVIDTGKVQGDMPVKVGDFYPRLCHEKYLTSLLSSEKSLVISFRMLPDVKTIN
jgi:hypothetical protein